jgi:hypothetical protein
MREEANQHPFECDPSTAHPQSRITVRCRPSFLRSCSDHSRNYCELTSNSRSSCMPGIGHCTYNGVALCSYIDWYKPFPNFGSTDISSTNNCMSFDPKAAGQSRTCLLRSIRQLPRLLTSFSWLISFHYTKLCIGERQHYVRLG